MIIVGFNLHADEEWKTSENENKLTSTVVFSEATKQFLIERLPLVLTLNLKRFVQHGRRLQKNSRHISFPISLNVAPFCTESCKVSVTLLVNIIL